MRPLTISGRGFQLIEPPRTALKASTKSRSQTAERRPAAPVGVIGLGLMGTSIACCLLAAGHSVIGIDRDDQQLRTVKRRVLALLKQMRAEGLLKQDPAKLTTRLTPTRDYQELEPAQLVVESVFEDLSKKKEVLRSVEDVVAPTAILGSNTSAIPVTILQQDARHPERILGLHWAEPAHITRFMEIICGAQTDLACAERVMAMAERWGKEPSLLRRDIRGFITNRIMYAMLREAFYLVENGYCTVADVDRSLRNDYGYWITFAGPFRFMDLTGIPAYAAVARDLFPELNCSTELPRLMSRLVESGAKGTANSKGFYSYAPGEAKRWEKRFLEFTYDIRKLALKYSEKPKRKHR